MRTDSDPVRIVGGYSSRIYCGGSVNALPSLFAGALFTLYFWRDIKDVVSEYQELRDNARGASESAAGRAYSNFICRVKGHWSLVIPPKFDRQVLVKAAAVAFKQAGKKDYPTMGKSAGCYETLGAKTEHRNW
jgi:hypothetical protein